MALKRNHIRFLPHVLISLLLVFGGCRNPFSPGLGDKIDISPPVISLADPSPGAFLQNLVSFSGSASDDQKVAAVRISFNNGATWSDVTSYDPTNKVWRHDIDTTTFPNGDFMVRLRVVDDAGKRADTENLVFTIDNLPPQIEIQVPALDPATYDPLAPPEVAMNGVILGIATDLQGIAVGYPQIKFWKDVDPEPNWDDRIGVSEVKRTTDFRYRLSDEHSGEVGIFNLRVRAVDASGGETIVPPLSQSPYKVNVVSGDVVPVIAFAFTYGDVNIVSGGTYAGDDFQFQAAVSHPNGIDSVTLQRTREGEPAVPFLWTADDLGSPIRTVDSPVFTVASDGSDDGAYEFRIETVSNTGSVAEYYRTVIVDATHPSVEITNLAPTVVDDTDPGNVVEYINGVVQINALATDANAVIGSKWWMLPSVSLPPTDYDSAGGTSFATSTPSLSLDSTSLPDNTEYKFYIISRDRARNDTRISRVLTVRQGTDIPTVSFTDIDTSITTSAAAGVGGINLLDTNARIRGILQDDDRIDVASVSLSLDGVPVVALDSIGLPGRSVSFSHNVDSLGQGVHSFQLEVSDDASVKSGKPAATKTVGPVYFVIDTAPPSISIDSPGAGTFQREAFTLSGTADDGNGLATVTPGGTDEYIEVAFPEAPATWIQVPVDHLTNSWSVTVGGGASVLFGGAFEGPRTVNIRARDRFGKLSTASFSFTVDTAAPTAAISLPAADAWLSGAADSVQGTASDATSSIAQVRFWIGDEGVLPPADTGTWTLASGTTSWNGSINLSALGEGRKTIHIRARDSAGNVSAPATRNFGIDQASPGITETVIGTADAGRNAAFSLGGVLTDSNSLSTLTVTQAKGADPAVTLENGAVTGTSQAWSIPDLPRNPAIPANLLLEDGVYTYTLTVTDAAGKSSVLGRTITVDLTGPDVTITAPTAGAAVQGTALSASGTAVDFGGVSPIAETRYYVTVPPALPPGDYLSWNVAAGTASWTASLTFGPLEEGPRVLHAAARDTAGNWSPAPAAVAFNIDQAPPEIQAFGFGAGTINTVGGTSYAKADFSFSFTAYDSNALANVRVTRNGTPIFDGTYSSTTEPVSVNETVDGPGLSDGIYEYVITVKDIVGKTATLTRSVVVDTADPLAEIASLNPLVSISGTDYVNGTIRFTASASDDNGLSGVKWWLLTAADPAPADYDAPGSTAFAAAPYTTTVDTGSLSDSTAYILYVVARDRALNETQALRAFTVEQSTDIPVVTITHPGTGAYVGSSYTVRGTVTDDDGVASATVQVSYHDGSAWSPWASAAVTGAGREVSFTYVLPVGIGADGPKQVRARADDDAAAKLGGDAAVQGISTDVPFTLDTLPPVVSILVPAANSAGRVTFTVSGEVVEQNLETLRLSLDGGSLVDASVAGAGETKTWTYDLPAADFDALSEGPHTISVEALDLVGRSHTVQRVFYKDTAGPAITFTSVVEGANTIVTEATPVLRGAFSDEYSDVSGTFEYRLDSVLGTDPWTSAAVTGSGKTVTWALPVDGLSDGGHTIDIRVLDAVGNLQTKEDVAFRLDRSLPAIVIDAPVSGGVYGTAAAGPVFTLSGTAFDANLTSVQAKLGSGPETDVTGSITAGTSTWVFPVAKADYDALVDGPGTVTITAADAAGRSSQTTWAFTKDTSAPSAAFNNLDLGGTTVLMDSQPRVQGGLTDAYGISSMESRLEKYDYGSSTWIQVEDWTSLGAPGGQTVVSWFKDLGSTGLNQPDGRYRISIRAFDLANPAPNGLSTPAVEFRIDRNNPSLTLNAGGLFQRADFEISGTAFDSNTISAVRAKVGDSDFSSGVVTTATTSNGYASWTLTVSTGGLSAGSYTVYVEAEDGAGRKSQLTREFSFDGTPPVVSISEPPNGSRVNGLVTVRGTTSDDNAVAQVQYRIGNGATTWQTAGLGGGLYSWSYTFTNINTYANTSDVTEVDPISGLPSAGTNVWALPFQVRVTDVAGNSTEELLYRLFVDPDMDAPEVTVISPMNDQIVGGEVRVSGYASDDDWVRSVEVRVDPTGTGTSFEAWEPATLVNQGTQVNWFKNINSSGELNPAAGTIRDVRIQVRAYDSKDYGVSQGIAGDTVELNVKFDSGVPVIQNIRIFRNGVEVEYAAGVRAAGSFSVRASVRDEGGIASIKWRREGQTVFTDILADPAYVTPPTERTAGSFEIGRKYLITSIGTTDFTAVGASSNTVGISFLASGAGAGTGTAYEATGPLADPDNQYFQYDVDISIDSTSINAGQYAGTTGFFSLDLQATDNATPTPYLTQSSLNIQIDNYFPFGEYTSSSGASTANYYIQGRAWDSGAGSGSIQGIDRVVVYFYKDGAYIAPNGGAFNATTRTLRDMTAGGTLQTVTFPADAASGIVIDGNEVTSDLDGSGYIEGFTDDGIYKNWYAVYDTNQLGDGPVDLHYVVIDRAENATRYVQSIYIRNNAPRISGVVIGTDLDGNGLVGDIASGESRLVSTAYGTTNFTVRNERLAFTVDNTGGNLPNRYSIGYVTGTAVVAAGDLVQGEVYTVFAAGTTNWTLLGASSNLPGTTFVAGGPGTGTGTATGYTIVQKNAAPFTSASLTLDDFSGMPDTAAANEARFVVKVYDSTVITGAEAVQLADAVVVGLNIDNVDDLAPGITAAPFGREYTSPASFSDADKALKDVDAYTENLVTSGSGVSLVKHGYAQYALHSGDGDADVSGKVVFLGKAADNQRIARITVQIPGYNGGAAFDIALWDGSALSAAAAGRTLADVAAGTSDWGFEAEAGSQAVTETYGHVLNWKFAWNSAALSTVTASDVIVTFTAYDAGPSGGNSSSGDLTVDVVPYITRVFNPTGQGGLSDTVIRSSRGRYSIEYHATNYFRASGFNLSGAVAHVSSAAIDTQPGTTNLTVAATTTTTVDIRKNFALSGYLTIFVNGIPSINNLNDPGQAYHSESAVGDPRSTLWTDDRYLTVWNLTQVLPAVTNQTFYYPSMVMNGNQPLFSYANDNDGYTYRTTGDAASARRGGIWFERHTALARSAGGIYWILSVQDAVGTGGIGYLYLNRDRNANALLGDTQNNNHFEIIGLDFTSRQMNRIRYPKLIVEGPDTATNIYVSYYDAHPSRRELSFVSFRATDATTSNLTQPANDAARAAQVQVIPNTSNASSEYFDMVRIGASEIAVAYFDESAGALKLQYSGNAWNANNQSGAGTWTEMTVDDSVLTGSHVSMTVGQRGGSTYLYLAYHDAAETALKFAQIDWATKSVTRVVVDNRFSVGTRTNVFVIDELPYVSFYSDSYSGTLNSIRLAYPVAANGRTAAENILQPGADANEEYTGNWEVAAVPALTVPKGGIEQFNRTQLNVYTNGTANLPVVAWLADRIEYARLQPPAP